MARGGPQLLSEEFVAKLTKLEGQVNGQDLYVDGDGTFYAKTGKHGGMWNDRPLWVQGTSRRDMIRKLAPVMRAPVKAYRIDEPRSYDRTMRITTQMVKAPIAGAGGQRWRLEDGGQTQSYEKLYLLNDDQIAALRALGAEYADWYVRWKQVVDTLPRLTVESFTEIVQRQEDGSDSGTGIEDDAGESHT